MSADAPRNLRLHPDAASGRKATSLDVAWDPVAGAVRYHLEIASSDGATSVSAAGSTYQLTALTPNRAYQMVVIAEFADGSTSAASERLASCTRLPVPPVPSVSALSTVGAASVVVTWDLSGLAFDATYGQSVDLVRVTGGQQQVLLAAAGLSGSHLDVGLSGLREYSVVLVSPNPSAPGGRNEERSSSVSTSNGPVVLMHVGPNSRPAAALAAQLRAHGHT
jgi:hypothetical protein